ncbi:MAG TPA: hypothetical protein VGK32_22590 [Vicinamibacterales bacterium]
MIVEGAHDVESLTRLQESAYLRSRLRYLLSSMKALAPPDLAPTAGRFQEFGLEHLTPMIRGLGGERELLALLAWGPDQAGHMAVSSRLGGDRFRLPPVDDRPWASDADAAERFARGASEVEPDHGLQIAEDQNLILASPLLECAPGVSPSSQDSEFLHFCVQLPRSVTAASSDLAAICLIRLDSHGTVVASVPTVCGRPVGGSAPMMTIRCNMGRALTTRPDRPGRGVQLFVSQWLEPEARLSGERRAS